MTRAWFWLACGLALLVPARASAARTLPDTVAALRAVTVEDLETRVPPAARPLLARLKQELRTLVVAAVTAGDRKTWEVARLRAHLRDALAAQGLRVGRDGSAEGYGAIHAVDLEQPEGFPELLVATTEVGINCGHDRSLYLFWRDAAGWSLRLALEAGRYRQINGAQSHLGYALLPARQRGEITLVTVDVPSWCTSVWRTIHYRILRLAPGADRPTVLLEKSAGAWLGGEAAYNLRTIPEGFQLSWYDVNRLDSALWRARVARYRVEGKRASRLPSPFPSPQDFLEDWLGLPWSEAARLSPPAERSALRGWHERLGTAVRKSCGAGIAFVQACPPPGARWQIGLSLSPEDCPVRLPSELYATVVREGEAYALHGLTGSRPPGCPGEREAESYTEREGWKLP
jgi:hypothetical protein